MIAFPDSKKNPNLYTDLAHEFADNGHHVYVGTVLERKFKKKTIFQKESFIQVLRVRCGNLFNVGFIEKGLTTVTIPYNLIRAIKKYLQGIQFDLVIFPTPPITFFKVVKHIKKLHHCRAYLILRDIFPQNARDLGLIKNNFVFNYFRRKEKKLYKISDYIGCMSKRNIEYIVNNNQIERKKCHLLPNWRKINKKTSQGISFREKYKLGNKFVAVFGGVIGLAQELEFLLELAKKYKDRDEIVFLLVGNGNRKKKILKIIETENLTNVMVRNRLPSKEFVHLVHQSDIGLVNINRNFTIPNFPSKTLDYFEAGIPVLAATDNNTDYGEFLEKEAKAGLWSQTGDLVSYQKNFEKLLRNKDLRRELGKNGRKYLEENLTVERAYKTIINHFR